MSKEIKNNNEKPNPLREYKKKFGDRKDGRRLRTVEPITTLIPFFMKQRNEASNLAVDSVELSPLDPYVRAKKNAGLVNFNVMHVLIAAYVRSISQLPGINRFVSGSQLYARNSIEVIMEVKKSLKINAPATMLKFKFNPYDTAEDIYHEMNTKITEYQNAEEEQKGFDKIARFLTYLPRVIYKLIVNIMIWQDNNRILPEFIREASPGHCSMLITSMASLGIPSIFHHLYDFGNCPIFISFSTARHAYEMNKDGVVEKKHYLDINYTLDDRICDGVYYAAGLRSIRRHLKNPHLLDVPPAQVVVDVL